MIPNTLGDVARWTLEGKSFDRCLWNFLDSFYSEPRVEALAEDPPRLAGHVSSGEIKDAYLAAVAEELARKFRLPHPVWPYEEGRKLHCPWFASDLQSLRAVLLIESPAGFRSRNLFVSENALSRA
jgi:hypothetical protein